MSSGSPKAGATEPQAAPEGVVLWLLPSTQDLVCMQGQRVHVAWCPGNPIDSPAMECAGFLGVHTADLLTGMPCGVLLGGLRE